MSHPFAQPHPTLHEYIGWCNLQGCTTQSGVMGSTTFHVLTAPSGRHVIVTGTKMSDRVVPSMVGYYDRRLGLDSPFAKIRGYS